MGVDIYSRAIIGQKLNHTKLNRNTLVNDCGHNPPKTSKFCPECGQPAWVQRNQPVVDLNEISPDIELVYTTDENEVLVALKDHYVSTGTSRGGGDDSGRMPLSNDAVEKSRKKLREILEPYDLWDEKEFGLWAVQSCSY